MKKFLVVALLLGLMAGAVMPAMAQEQTFTVTGKAVLVYAEPRTDSLLIAVMSTGSTLVVLGPQQNGFSNVRTPDGRTGWAQLGIEAIAPGGTAGSPTGVILVAVDNIRLRERPSLNARQIGSIGWGDTMSLIGFDEDREWAQVNYQGVVGWAFYAFLRVVQGNVGGVAVGEQPVATTGSGSTVVALGNVIIREEPNLGARRLTLAGWGDSATFLGFNDTGNWIQVSFGGFTGWSLTEWWRDANGNVLVLGTVPNTTVAPNPTPTTQVPAGASTETGVVVVALGNVRIRNTPSLSGTEIGNIAWGDTAAVSARDASDLWFLITINGVTGWVARDWFEVLSGNPGGLPIQQ